MNSLCSCLEIKDTSHYLLYCHHFCQQRIDLTSREKSICDNFESMSDNNKEGGSLFDENKNKFILEATKNYIKNSERFSGSIFEESFVGAPYGVS